MTPSVRLYFNKENPVVKMFAFPVVLVVTLVLATFMIPGDSVATSHVVVQDVHLVAEDLACNASPPKSLGLPTVIPILDSTSRFGQDCLIETVEHALDEYACDATAAFNCGSSYCFEYDPWTGECGFECIGVG